MILLALFSSYYSFTFRAQLSSKSQVLGFCGCPPISSAMKRQACSKCLLVQFYVAHYANICVFQLPE